MVRISDLEEYKQRSAEEISAEITQNIESYIETFNDAFSSAFQKYQTQQEEDLKTELKHVYICYLRSSITENLPFFRIDLYDKADIEDLKECSADWSVLFSKTLYEAIPPTDGTTIIDEKYGILSEELWFKESELFFQALKSYMPEIIAKSRQGVSPDVQWHYGEYLDLCTEIL